MTSTAKKKRGAIRPLAAGDVDAVAELVQKVNRSGGAPPRGLAEALQRTYLESPMQSGEAASLVLVDGDDRITAFLGVMLHGMQMGDREIRVACSGPLVVDDDAAGPGAGLMLTRKLFKQGYDLYLTDGGTRDAVDLWTGLGGFVPGETSFEWTRVFRPLGRLQRQLSTHPRLQSAIGRGITRVLAALQAPLDGLARAILADRWRAKPAPPRCERLTADDLCDGLEALSRTWSMHAAPNRRYLAWLFERLGELRSRGMLHAAHLLSGTGAPIGWYVYYLGDDREAQVLQIAAARSREPDVLHALFADADARGAVSMTGRCEPRLLSALEAESAIELRLGPPYSVLFSEDDDVRASIAEGDALLTRLEGEWWLAFHLEPYDGGRSHLS